MKNHYKYSKCFIHLYAELFGCGVNQIPPNCIVALLPVTQLTGTYGTCAFRFQNNGVKSIKVNIGGQVMIIAVRKKQNNHNLY